MMMIMRRMEPIVNPRFEKLGAVRIQYTDDAAVKTVHDSTGKDGARKSSTQERVLEVASHIVPDHHAIRQDRDNGGDGTR